jgi:hypothetical protein
MLKYIIKNEYIKNANRVQEGKFVPKWKHKYELSQAETVAKEELEVELIINNHKYKVI